MQSYCSSSYKDHIEIHIYMWLCVRWAEDRGNTGLQYVNNVGSTRLVCVPANGHIAV